MKEALLKAAKRVAQTLPGDETTISTDLFQQLGHIADQSKEQKQGKKPRY